MYTLNTVTTFVFALSFMSSLNPWLTLAIVLPVPGISYITYRMGKKIHDAYKSVQEQYEHVTTHAQETFSGVRVVRAYAREHAEADRFRDLSQDYYQKNMRLARVQSLIMPAMGVLFNASYLIVIAIGGYLITQNTLTVGELTQFFIYLNQLMWPIMAIGWVTNMVQRGAASVGRIGVVLDSVPPISNAQSTVTETDLPASIAFRDVSLQYGERVVLQNITLDVPAGTSLGIVGAVGSGKSSIAGLIPRQQDASRGAVLVGGHDVRTLPLQTVRGMVGVVPQESFLFSDTIRENIRFGDRTLSEERVHEAARIAQFDAEIAALPNGYDTVVGERGVTLSGGQKQRCALARAIASDPKILILDDALSAIDSDTESRIMKGLSEVMRARTTIVIAHRISTVQRCDQIIVLDDGRITERGSHAELIALGGAYAEMYERQQLEEELA
jgi:ATP-binding cassette subfamily B protein